jgi:hypothetical protein
MIYLDVILSNIVAYHGKEQLMELGSKLETKH